MPNGHLQDPRMNSIEKEFGTLISSDIGKDGRAKTIIYLKDDISRNYTFGSPVTFDLQEREILYDNSNGTKRYVTIEVATNVRIDEEKIIFHPVVNRLNDQAREILSRPVAQSL